jgi:hypothetical protein
MALCGEFNLPLVVKVIESHKHFGPLGVPPSMI